MGKASSAKKIARAERAGATTGPSERRSIGFPTAVGLVIVLGLGLVIFARATRDAEVTPTLQDHWHAAYGIWDCVSDSFLPVFQSEYDPEGIHSHQDGLIHIHPFTASVTGKQAQLSVFLYAMGAEISEEALILPGDQSLKAGVDCGGEEAVIQVVRWANAFEGGDPAEVATENLGKVRFLDDLEAFTIARAPLGADIPMPDRIDILEGVSGQSRDGIISRPNTSNIPGPQDFGTEGE
ncbi:MAG: hypothetical protein VX725_01495 [Actinomycetota bacterium]|nr:hypothetical protein [Actinomycetota bacterium]MEC8974415.1 hypothetical protein [Actinomycetota bacterium]